MKPLILLVIFLFIVPLGISAGAISHQESPTSASITRVVLDVPLDTLPGIVEERLDTKNTAIPTVTISTAEAEQYRASDAEYRQRIANRFSQVDLDLHYSLKEIGADRSFGIAPGKESLIPVYLGADTHSTVVGHIQLPTDISVVTRKDNFVKLRVQDNKAVWMNIYDLGSQSFHEQVQSDIDAALLRIEAQSHLQRCYYREPFLERAFLGSAGVLGSAALLADGLTRSGAVAFTGTSLAGVAQGLGTVLGAVEVLGGLYIGWNSVAYLFDPQERFVYREWDGKQGPEEVTTVQIEHALENMVPATEPESVPESSGAEQY